MKTNVKEYRLLGILFILYFVFSMTCYFVLAVFFEFPDILRMSAEYRFNLFRTNQAIIMPAYYFWMLTGVLLVFMAALFYSIIPRKKALDLCGLIMGILSGVFQMAGFIRWVILIPVLSSAYNGGEISKEFIIFIEKLLNTYLGMTLGEHFGNLFLAVWLLLISIRILRVNFAHKSLGILGIIISVFFIVFSFESVNSLFSILSYLTVPVWGAFTTWLILMAISLFSTKQDKNAPRLHWAIWLGGGVFWLLNVIPAFIK